MSKIRALVGCQNQGCAEEVSYHLDMVAMFEGQPICQGCYENGEYGEGDWHDLPPVKLADLSG